jgi:hypothetical protein
VSYRTGRHRVALLQLLEDKDDDVVPNGERELCGEHASTVGDNGHHLEFCPIAKFEKFHVGCFSSMYLEGIACGSSEISWLESKSMSFLANASFVWHAMA